MGVLIRRFEDVYEAIRRVPPNGRVFCFFAIDDRPGHRELLSILESSREWIDDLSAASGIYSFLPVSRWSELKNPPGFMFKESFLTQEESAFLTTFEKQECYTNPSLLLARQFGITPRELPGLVVFKALPEAPPQDPLFVPFDSGLLRDRRRFEEMIAELFSRVQEVWNDAREHEIGLDTLRTRLSSLGSRVRLTVAPSAKLNEVFNDSVDDAQVDYSDAANFPYIRHAERKAISLFLSYASEDYKRANVLYRRFAEAGFSPWMDKHDIVAGEIWDTAIQRALKNADFFVACLSNASVRKRGFLQREFKVALDKWRELLEEDIYILPIRLDDCEIPDQLSTFQWIDLQPSSAADGGWGRIMQSITEGVRRRRT